MSNSWFNLPYDGALNILDIDARTAHNGEGSDQYTLEYSSSNNKLNLKNDVNPEQSSSVFLNSGEDNYTISLDSNKITLNNVVDPSKNTVVNLNGRSGVLFNEQILINNNLPQGGFGLVQIGGGTDLRTYIGTHNNISCGWVGTQSANPLNLYTGNVQNGPMIQLNTDNTINFYNNKLQNVATPINDADVATKKYVDDHSSDISGSFLPLTGGNLTGDVTNTNTFISTKNIGWGLQHKNQVNDSFGTYMNANRVCRFGTQTNNDLEFFTNNNDALITLTKSVNSQPGKIFLSSQTSLGNNKITLLGDATEPTDALNKQTADASYLKNNGGEINGMIEFTDSGYGGLKNTFIIDDTGSTFPLRMTTGSNNRYIQFGAKTENGRVIISGIPGGIIGDSSFNWLDIDGPNVKINNGLNMDNSKITNVPTPTSSNDVANKSYVDSKIVAGAKNEIIHYDIDGRLWCEANNFLKEGATTRIYISAGGPLIADQMVNWYYRLYNQFALLTTAKENPSLFNFYGTVYKPSASQIANGIIKKGSFTINLNIPCLINSQWNTNTQMLCAQCILGGDVNIIGTNKQVECYGSKTVSVTNYLRKSNSYGTCTLNPLPSVTEGGGYDNKMQAVDIAVEIDIDHDIIVGSSSLLNLYVHFASANPTYEGYTNIYTNYLPCDTGTGSDDLVTFINGTATYQEDTGISSPEEEEIDNILPKYGATSHTKTNYVYTNLVADKFEPDETFREKEYIENENIDEDYIHSIKKTSNDEQLLTLFYDNSSNPAIFDDMSNNELIINNIYDCSIKIKNNVNTSTLQQISISTAFKTENVLPDIIDISLDLIPNNTEWNSYRIDWRKYDASYNEIIAIVIKIPAGVNNISIDNFQIHYVEEEGGTREKNVYWKIPNDDTNLQDANTIDIDKISNKIKDIEDYLTKLKQTYTIVEN